MTTPTPNINRFLFWQLLASTLCLVFAAPINEGVALAQTQQRPNILFIYLDDFGWRDCSYAGSDFYETPNLDRLASEGMVFTDAYACAANCAPARACLMTSQYTPRHEIYNVGTGLRGKPEFSKLKHIPGVDTLKNNIKTWAQCIQQSGYKTGIIGKWHLSDNPLPYGFDVNIAGSHSGSPPRGYFPPHPNAPGLKDAPADEYLTNRLNAEAIKFIEQNRQQPWLLYLSHFAVHTPLQAEKDLLNKYESKPDGELHSSAVMAAMIESVDRGVGQLVDKLVELGIEQTTAIVFTSDNGGYGNATRMDPLKGYKGSYYEGGIRVPFFVKWPGVVSPGGKCEQPISGVDLFPTLCEIAGATLPAEQIQDGVTLVPVLKGKGSLPERSLFWHFPAYLESSSRIDGQRDALFRTRPCSIMRRGDWKLHEYFEDGALELYNLKEDIGEQKNLAKTEADKLRKMHDELQQWRAAVSAPVPSELNPKFDAMAESLQRMKETPADAPGTRGLVSSEFIYALEGRPTPECHASTIVETSDGLLVAWFGGKHENNPDVGIWLSRQNGQKWSTPVQVVDGSEGETQDYACWNPVLFQPSSGPLMLFYKVGLNPRMWWGNLITSNDAGKTWSEPRRLGQSNQLFSENQNLLGPVKNKPIELADGTLLSPSSTENEGWRVHFELSRDLGKTWEVIGPLSAGTPELDAIQPSILRQANGRLQIVCRTKQGVLGTSSSNDNGRTWEPMRAMQLPNPNSGTDAVTLADGRHLLVYNHSQRTRQKDGRQVLHVALSADGENWQTKLTLENESNENGYSYPAVIQTADGLVHITYTWRRETIKHVVLDPSKL